MYDYGNWRIIVEHAKKLNEEYEVHRTSYRIDHPHVSKDEIKRLGELYPRPDEKGE